MSLPTCQCNAGLPIQDQLANIYCALYTFTGGAPLSFPLSPAQGGTGLSIYTIGDMLYASGATTLSKLADVATGNVLLSGGVGVAPSWGKVDLAAAVSGVLPVANGGNGVAQLQSFSANKGGTNQTGIASGFTLVVVTFSTEDWDTGNVFASSKCTPSVAGKWTFNSNITWANPGNNALFVRKNGATLFRLATGIGDYGPAGSVTIDMNGTTDYVELCANQQSGAPNDISGTVSDTYFQGRWSGP